MNSPKPLRLKIIAPPPVLYLVTLLLSFAIQAVIPIYLLPTIYAHTILGGFLFILSVALARWAFVTMRHLGTSPNPYSTSKALATDGPFRFSRNPIYVAMTGLYIGISFIANAAWPMVLLVPLLALMYWGVIQREEDYLSAQFGNAYTVYQSKVRRWL